MYFYSIHPYSSFITVHDNIYDFSFPNKYPLQKTISCLFVNISDDKNKKSTLPVSQFYNRPDSLVSTQLHYTTHLESRAERQFNRTEIRLYDVQYTPITF